MTMQEIADVKLALERVETFSTYQRPTSLQHYVVLLPCAREHLSNYEWAKACDRLEACGVLKSVERNIWYTT